VFATESLAQTLRQMEVWGRDGLPVLSADGQRAEGWVTGASVLRAIARQISEGEEHADKEAPGGEPPAPLNGYQVIELTVTDASPAAGAQLGAVAWPPGSIPVALLRDHAHQSPDPALTLRPGDRISLLAPAPAPAHRTSTPQ
jgi:CIC family chloride channel protein